MASTHDIEMARKRQPGLEEDKQPRLAMTGERARLALAGLWLTLGLLAAVIVVVYLVIALRAHTPTLTPGQPQAPAAAAVLSGKP
jgi:hypothetical protein